LGLPAARAADVIVILDNDVITPPGHVDRLVDALLADPRAGVIGPAVLDLPRVSEPLGLGSDERRLQPVANDALGALGTTLLDEAAWFHLGTNSDWRAAYLDERQLEQRLVAGAGAAVDPFFAMNHHDPAVRRAVAGGAARMIPAANIAGCCQAFRRELLDEIGDLHDEFSPYGFEDVDFCVRALNAGRRNYVVPSILMLHGTDRRHHERRVGAQVARTQRNFMRCKSLFAWHQLGAVWPSVIEASIVRRYALTRQTGTRRAAIEHLHAHVAGVLDARRQIHHLSVLAADRPPTG
jgi:GT2 family glycosyltransferase